MAQQQQVVQVQQNVRVITVNETPTDEYGDCCNCGGTCIGCCLYPKEYERYKSKPSTVLGWLQVAVALFSIIMQSAGIGVQDNRRDPNVTFYSGAGIWASAFFIVSGGLAIGAAKKKTCGMIVSNLIMSIFSAVFAFIFMIISAVTVSGEDHSASAAIGTLLLIMSLVEIFVSIIASGLGCAAICCKGKPNIGYATSTTTTVIPAVHYSQQPFSNIQPAGAPGNQSKAYVVSAEPTQPPPAVQVGNNWYTHQTMAAPTEAPPQYSPPSDPPTYTVQDGSTDVHMPAPVSGNWAS